MTDVFDVFEKIDVDSKALIFEMSGCITDIFNNCQQWLLVASRGRTLP